MKKNKYMKYAALSLSLLLFLSTGCTAKSTENGETAETVETSQEASKTTYLTDEEIAAYYKDEDTDSSFDLNSSTVISFDTDSAEINGEGASFEDSTLNITKAGTYVLSGKLSGSVCVNASENDLVRIVLNGTDITSDKNSAINSVQSDKTIIILAENTENTLTDAEEYVYDTENTDANAALFSKNSLTITGSGSLTVNGNFNNGIGTKDDLRITGGNLTVNAENNGLKGNDSVRILDGKITVNSNSDGIKSDNTEDADKGFVMINGGELDITSLNDGIQAETSLTVTDGTFNIVSGGGSTTEFKINSQANETEKGTRQGGTDFGGNGGRNDAENGNMPQNTPPDLKEMPDTQALDGENTQNAPNASANASEEPEGLAENQSENESENESDSAKGVKSAGDILITGGSFNINSLDDAVHSNQNVTIADGTFIISTDDDAVHSDTSLLIEGGGITVASCYEGLEAASIIINAGTIDINANDDGINAADGSGSGMPGQGGQGQAFESSDKSDYSIKISGGTVRVNANGDGLDSNGSFYMEGGTVIVDGPVSNGNGSLDYDAEALVSGGILVYSGSSGMAQSFDDSSSQNSIMVYYSETQKAGTAFNLSDENGSSIVTYIPQKDYQCILITSPEISQGETYTLSSGGESDAKETNGLYVGGTYTNGTKVCDIEVSAAQTKINSDGTEYTRQGGQGGMGGQGGQGGQSGPGGMKGQGGKTQTPPDFNNDTETENTETTEIN